MALSFNWGGSDKRQGSHRDQPFCWRYMGTHCQKNHITMGTQKKSTTTEKLLVRISTDMAPSFSSPAIT
jgi:hypothetical protein